jgi:hypothetical protein
MKSLLVLTAAAFLLTGCATSPVHQTEQWEYKLVKLKYVERGFQNGQNASANIENARKVEEEFLNEMAKDGWIYIEQKETGVFYFKRAKR